MQQLGSFKRTMIASSARRGGEARHLHFQFRRTQRPRHRHNGFALPANPHYCTDSGGFQMRPDRKQGEAFLRRLPCQTAEYRCISPASGGCQSPREKSSALAHLQQIPCTVRYITSLSSSFNSAARKRCLQMYTLCNNGTMRRRRKVTIVAIILITSSSPSVITTRHCNRRISRAHTPPKARQGCYRTRPAAD